MTLVVFATDGPVISTFTSVNSTTVIQNVNKAQVKVRAKKDNVAGQFKNTILNM